MWEENAAGGFEQALENVPDTLEEEEEEEEEEVEKGGGVWRRASKRGRRALRRV